MKNEENQSNSKESIWQKQEREEKITKIQPLTPKRRRSIKTKMANQPDLHPERQESSSANTQIENLTSGGMEAAITITTWQPSCSKTEQDIKNKMADQQNRQLQLLKARINEIQRKIEEKKIEEKLRDNPKTEITK